MLDKNKYYKILFLCAALYNCVNSIVFILASLFMPDIFSTFGIENPPSLIWLHLTLVFIILFGIGYILVALNLDKNHGLVVIGGLAKISFFVITLIYMILGDANFLIVVLGGLDILFVCLFIEFLLKYDK